MFVRPTFRETSTWEPYAYRPHTALDVTYSPNGQYLALVYANGQLEVIDVATNTNILDYELSLPYSLLRAKVGWSPSGSFLAAGIGGYVYLWNFETLQLLRTLHVGSSEEFVYSETGEYLPEGIISLEWSSDANLLLTQSLSSRYTVWSPELGKFVFDQSIGNNPLPVVWLSDNTHIFDVRSTLDFLKQNRFGNPSQQISWVGSRCSVRLSMATNLTHARIAIGTANGCIIIVDANTGNQVAAYKISNEDDPIWDIGWSSEGESIAAVTDQGRLLIFNIESGDYFIASQNNGPLYTVDWAESRTLITYGGRVTENSINLTTLSDVEIANLIEAGLALQPVISSTPDQM